MRSIHKKTLKRFLSTLLALTMVLGMVPFTALAAPTDYVLTVDAPDKVAVNQVVDASSTLMGLPGATALTNVLVKVEMTTTVSGSHPRIIANNGIDDFNLADPDDPTHGYWGTPGGFSVNESYTATTPLKLSFDKPGTYTAKFSLMDVSVHGVETEIVSGTKTITVVGITDLKANPTSVKVGEQFTVRAKTNLGEGTVEFDYGTQQVSVDVKPLALGGGYAECTLTAETGETTVTATLFGISGLDAVTETANITVNAADTYYDVTFMVDGLQYGEKQSVKSGENAIRPVDPLVADGKVFAGWYTDNTFATAFDFNTAIAANTTVYGKVVDKLSITFLPGAADAYIPFSPTTVSVKQGDSYPLPTAKPTREGYTFKGWDKDGNGTADYTASATIPAGDIAANMTLNAVWEVQKVAITWGTLPAGVTANSGSSISEVNKGSTVYFTLTLADGYDPSTLVVKANDQPLAPVKAATNMYQYSFVANAATTVTITEPSKLTYTVMMPVGHFTAQITAVNGSTITPAASASVQYGKDYTFTVTPATGYELKGVYVNGALKSAETDGSYKVENVTSAQTVEVVVDEIPSYTVTFTVPLTGQTFTQTVTKGNKATAPVVAPEREGYTFGGWYTGDEYNATSGTAFDFNSPINTDTILYGKLNPATYNITYDANGGSGAPTAQTKTHGLAITLQPGAPTKAGHTFLGWGTTATATAASYQPGDMYSTDANITLYAVWQINTFTVTLPNGTGYTAMPASGSSSPVNYDGSFSFTVTVDPEYAVAEPEVKVNGGAALTDPTPTPNADGSKTYTYTISNIQENKVVSIQVTRNEVHTVTFMVNGSVYQTQQVEHNAKATVPNPPSVEGYTFEGWYVNLSDASAYNFGTPVTADLTLNAKMTAITPKVTYPTSGTGWTLTDVVLSDTSTAVANNSTVAYKSSIDFKVIVAKGYDATNLAVAANGLALNPVLVTENPDGTTTYSFMLSNITADQKITVTGVVRKMITITYNDNGGIGGPGQEQVPMYVPIGDEGKISNVKPTRVGYTFLGWAKANADGSIPTAKQYDPGATADFTTDTTLYAVWSAKTTTVTLEVSNTTLTNAEYEGEDVTLTATVTSGSTAVTSGSVQFYRYTGDPDNTTEYANENNWKHLDSKVLSGGKATLTIATSKYVRAGQNKDSYKAVFVPDEGAGYSTANSAATKVTVTVLSTAISWKLNASSQVDTKANELTIKDSNGATVTSMTAGQEYTLELPKIYALDDQATALVVNKDYKVTWQFCNASGTWEDYTAAAGTNSVKILAEYSQYVFRAVVTPLTGATGHFTQAAKYNAATTTTPATLIANQYEAYLVTEATSPVAQQATATSLAVTDTHDLTDGTVAEFEGQEVTLTATVTLTGSSTTKVTTGEVYFYKAYNYTSNTGTLIGKANVQSDGTAVLEAEMSTYVAGTSDVFTAVYQSNPTYATSVSSKTVGGDKVGESVLIRSTAIAWAKDTSGAEVKTLTVTPTGDIYADNQYTLTLPAIKEEGQDVTLTVGTDYVVSWYMVKADKTVVLLAENTESNTYTVVPPTAGVTYYAVVSPKAGSNYTDAYEGGETKNFLTSAETAASVKAPTITTITFGDVKTDTGKTPDFSQYEEKTITITAKVVEADLTTPANAKDPEEVVKSGTVTFYVVTKSDGTYEKIGTATVSNGLATVSYKLPEYDLADGLKNIEYFFAVYSDTAGTYADSNTTGLTTPIAGLNTPDTADDKDATLLTTGIDSNTEAVQILSTSISWKLDTSNTIVAASATTTDANKLKVYAGDTTAASALVSDGKMTAGSTYTLELPAVYALDDAQTAATALTVNKDYIVVWQYREFGASEWQGYPNGLSSDTALITPTYSGYQFQAIVTPIYDNEHLTGYKTAAAYDSSDVATGKTSFLVTDPTEKTERQATTTTLAITGADDEAATVKINGATPFNEGATPIGAHWAQFEGQTVTLTATVKETSTNTPAVGKGSVEFYQNGTLIATVPVQTEGTDKGKASCTATMTAFTGTVATAKKDTFYAKYVENDSFAASTSESDSTVAGGYRVVDSGKYYEVVYIKSTAIQTPVIDAKRGTTNEGSTSYAADLTGLLAGVEHKFTLRTTGAEATGLTSDWSVVALDGRTVASTDYTIKWLATTGDNEEATVANGSSYTTSDNKVGDMFRVELVPTGDMKTGATSKYAKIGTKQDVNVTVTASDEIASTTDTDVYQLNPITLTATVAAAQGANATVKPSGTVAFYYQDGTSWVYLGEAVLDVDTDGEMRASITTTKLPVDAIDNTKRDVTISVTYTGDKTFNEITDQADTKITQETVTVYSSVVYVNSNVENKTVTVSNANKNHNSGIYIFAEEDKVLANETNVNLKLSDVYTLDHDPMLALSKLAHGVDYTVQWQVLGNAAAYSDKTTAEGWEYIDDATGVTCQIDVEDGAAYRAVITVKDTPIAKGSYTFVDQDIDGRRVYYSNILVAADAPATVTVNVNTSNTADGYEGIVEGETVTIHTYTSGASGTTPISELTVTITDATGAEVEKQVKTNVNGHVSFDWAAAQPGYYELKVVAKFTNGYDDKIITRTLIVRDNAYDFTAAGDNTTYNGKVQGLTVTVNNMGIESDLAQKSVVVYYYTDANRTQQVEPTQAGTYYATIRLQESAYWTEKTLETTFTIEKRAVEIDDVIVQAKVYNGSDSANVQEIILKDAATDQTGSGLPSDNKGVINGDSVYAIGTAVTNSANVNEATKVTVTVTELLGNDAANYTLVDNTYTEDFTIQRSQVKGDIADSTFQYTGSNITVPADDIYLIDQAGNVITPANYTVTYYYHNGDGVEKVTAMNKLGKYTVIARPEQANYKGGASQTVYVVSGTGVPGTLTTYTSALIDITNTVELYGNTHGVTVNATKGTATASYYYNDGTTTDWHTSAPTDAGRYLVKATVTNGTVTDTAYGIYTIVKANPVLTLTAADKEYNSAQYNGTPDGTFNGAGFPAGTYYTYTGGTIQGVAYEAPTEVGTYIVTAHVPETDDYTAHEISAQFVITPKALKITADSLQRRQYGAFPDMTASFDGLATGGVAADTSLRDVQIQPELIFNETDSYDNIAMDHVGNEYPIIAIAALARNYDVSYVNGNLSVTRDEPNPYLAIHGMIDNGNGGDIAYYGDVIQLYAYGSQSKTTGVINNSSVLTWEVTGPATITQNGLLTIIGVGTVEVKLTRGVGAQKISTTLPITALKKEVKVSVPDEDVVYNATTKTYTVGNMKAYNEKFNDVSATIDSYNTTRIPVGSQIVTGQVASTETYYQSETYGGLFTINDKDVTVTPNAQTVTYGDTLNISDDLNAEYTVVGKEGSVEPLTNTNVASVRELYNNLDVANEYEILVTGTENINYNVKYVTAPTAPQVTVTDRTLNVKTGVYAGTTGQTSGSLNPAGEYPNDDRLAFSASDLNSFAQTTTRMYGEPNQVMGYVLETLVGGDSEADLTALFDWLVKYDFNIAGHASVTYPNHNTAINPAGYDTSIYTIPTAPQQIVTGATMMNLVNYDEDYQLGTQNIYQRPVTLALSNGQTTLDIYYSEILRSGGTIDTAKLLNIIINNVEAGKYNDGTNYVGGLAELLKHTVKDLNLQVAVTGYTGTPSTPDYQFTATVTVGNPNYWLGNAGQKFDITVNILLQRLTVDYTTFTATFSDVILYEQTETTRTPAYATGEVTFKIYRYVEGKENYSYYAANEATVFSGTMTMDTSRTGRYYVTYPKLSAGTYRVFAVASGYTIID